MPSASKTSCEPERDDRARLPCLATFTPQAARISAAEVDTLTEPEPSPPVPQLSSSTGKSVSTRNHALAHGQGSAHHFVDGFALHAQGRQQAHPTCAGVAAPSMI
jgi:hypothetical protein